ncbi:hypothetical protein KBG31_03240 [Patescibacteria group bacterium]|nr:hypothetical protein [Patescibacteria group bacterium]
MKNILEKNKIKTLAKNLPLILVGVLSLIGIFALVLGSNSQNSGIFGTVFRGNNKPSFGNSIPTKTYSDEICEVSFMYPENWEESKFEMPLSIEPASYLTLNTPQNPALFSYICIEGEKPSFEQLIGVESSGQELKKQRIGGNTWVRWGPFAYLEKGDKLFILRMYGTKYDISTEQNGTQDSEYENIFLAILDSFQE